MDQANVRRQLAPIKSPVKEKVDSKVAQHFLVQARREELHKLKRPTDYEFSIEKSFEKKGKDVPQLGEEENQ